MQRAQHPHAFQLGSCFWCVCSEVDVFGSAHFPVECALIKINRLRFPKMTLHPICPSNTFILDRSSSIKTHQDACSVSQHRCSSYVCTHKCTARSVDLQEASPAFTSVAQNTDSTM